MGFALVAGLLAGYAAGDFGVAVKAVLASTVLAMLLTVPNWPFLNRHPLEWQPVEKKPDDADADKDD